MSHSPKPIRLSLLPFQQLSNDDRIGLFCTGLRMDILTELARFRSLQIITAEAAEAAPNQLDYLVKGLARFHKDYLQINLQLIQVSDNRLIWAEKFGDTLERIFQLEEAIIRKIVVSVQQSVDYDLLAQIRQRSLTDLSAYENWLYGMEELKKGRMESDERARTFFQAAIQQDPAFARAYTGMSLTYFNEWSCLLWDKWEEHQQHAIDWALRAVQLDQRDPATAYILGKCYLFYKQFGKAEYHLRQALELNPADPKLLAGIAFCLVYLNHPEEALILYQRAAQADPSKTGFILTGSLIYFENGHYEEAIQLGEANTVVAEWIDFQATLAAAHFHLQQFDRMWECWNAYVAYFHKTIRPNQPVNAALALEWMIEVNPYREQTRHQPFWDFIQDQLPLSTSQASVQPTAKGMAANQFLQEGAVWQLRYQAKQAQFPDLKGLHDIARLLREPGQAVHCADLMGMTVFEDGTPVLDKTAKRAYERRLLEIQEALAEAKQLQQADALVRWQTEYDHILDQLSQSVGKGGASRKTGGSVEKARTAVTWRIRSAIKKIEVKHPELGAHLRASIKTGLFCSYQPEYLPNWELV